MASAHASLFCTTRTISPVRLRPGLAAPFLATPVQRQGRPGPRRASPTPSPGWVYQAPNPASSPTRNTPTRNPTSSRNPSSSPSRNTPTRNHPSRNIPSRSPSSSPARTSPVGKSDVPIRTLGEELGNYRHVHSSGTPLRQRRPPASRSVHGNAPGASANARVTTVGPVVVPLVTRSSSGVLAQAEASPSKVTRSVSTESLTLKPQRQASGNPSASTAGNVGETSVRLRAPPSAARTHTGVAHTPPIGVGSRPRDMSNGRAPMSRKADRSRSASANRNCNSFEPPKRSVATRTSSHTPPPSRKSKYKNLENASLNDEATLKLASRLAAMNGNNNELLNTLSTATQGDSILVSTHASSSSAGLLAGTPVLGHELESSVPTLPPSARPLGPPQSLAIPPGGYEALRHDMLLDSVGGHTEALGNEPQISRSVSCSSIATVQEAPSCQDRSRDFPFCILADLELGGPAMRADAAKHGSSSCSGISSPRTICHTTRGVEDYVIEPMVSSRSDATTRGKQPDDGVLLRREKVESGSATIAVDDESGNRLGTFGEECVQFELRCKDSNKIDAWLENIETRMLPGLLSLLEDEVNRRSQEVGNQREAARTALWNPRIRSSMLKAHDDLRRKLLQLTENRVDNALAG